MIYKNLISLNNPFLVETKVSILNISTSFTTNLTIEFDKDNRIVFSVGSIKEGEQFRQFSNLTFEEQNSVVCSGCTNSPPFPLLDNQPLTLKIEYNPSSKAIKGFVDNYIVVEGVYNGITNDAQVGLATTVFPNNSVDTFFDYFKVEQEGSSVSLDVQDIKQNDPRWKDQEYNSASNWSSNPSIERWGCALTSASMILQYYNHPINPDTLNNCLMTQPDGYIGNGLLNWLAISRYSYLHVGPESPVLEYRRFGSDTTILDQELTANPSRPAILKLPGHFVVAKGKQSSDYLINDPVSPKNLISELGGNFLALNQFRPSETGLSYLLLTIDANYNLKVFGPDGTEINGYTFTEEPLIDDISGLPASGNPLRIFQYPTPSSGNYRVGVEGPLGNYTLKSFIYNKNGSPKSFEQEGYSNTGQKDSFNILIGKKPQVDFLTSIDLVIDDWENAKNMGLIKNAYFYKTIRSELLTAKMLINQKRTTQNAKSLLTGIRRQIKQFTPLLIDKTVSSFLQNRINQLVNSL